MNYHTRRYEHSCCPNDPGFVSNYWVREYICFQPLPSWLCVRLKQSTLLSRVSALNRKMIWCKRQIISQKITVQYIANLDLCLFSQPSPPFFWDQPPPMTFRHQDVLKDFINWTCQMRRVPGNQLQCISGWALCLFLAPMMCLNTPLMFVCSLE